MVQVYILLAVIIAIQEKVQKMKAAVHAAAIVKVVGT